MNCARHTSAAAFAICQGCGRAVCAACDVSPGEGSAACSAVCAEVCRQVAALRHATVESHRAMAASFLAAIRMLGAMAGITLALPLFLLPDTTPEQMPGWWGFAASLWLIAAVCAAGALMMRPSLRRYRALAADLAPRPMPGDGQSPTGA